MLEKSSVVKNKPTNYFKKEQFMLKICGMSLTGNESAAYKTYSFFVMYCIVFPYPLVASYDLFKHEVAAVAETTLVYLIGGYMDILICGVAFYNRLNLGKLLQKLQQEPFLPNTERGGDKEEKLLNDWISIKEKQGLMLCLGAAVMFVYRIIITSTKRLRSSDYHDWEFTFGSITVLNVTYSPNYEMSWMYQNIAVFYIVVNTSLIVLILVAILANISVQFQILQNNIKRMVSNSHRNMLKNTANVPCLASTLTEIDASLIPWRYLKISLKDAVHYQLEIIQTTTDLVNLFSNTILFMYMCAMGMTIFEVYRTSMLPVNDARLPMQILESLAVSMHSLVICYSGQKITDESFMVANAAYEANYAGVDTRFQKGLVMIINRSQRPLIIKAGKFIETSLVTYVWIMKTAYSACMVLRRVQHK